MSIVVKRRRVDCTTNVNPAVINSVATKSLTTPDLLCNESLNTPNTPITVPYELKAISPTKPAPDSRIPYKIGDRIGGGTYSVVFRGTSSKDPSKKYAFKKQTLRACLSGEMANIVSTMIVSEINILQNLSSSPHVVKYVDEFSIDDNTSYIVTSLHDCDLFDVFDEFRKRQLFMPLHDVKSIMKQILTGISHAHERMYVHRDLKPSNIMMNVKRIKDATSYEVFIGDWGMACLSDKNGNIPLTDTVTTLWYRAPEIIMENVSMYDSKIDMWSIGCIMGEMLRKSCVPLFRGENDDLQMSNILSVLGTPSQYGSSLPKHVGKKLYDIRGLEHLSNESYADALDLLERLLQFNPSNRIDAVSALKHQFFQ